MPICSANSCHPQVYIKTILFISVLLFVIIYYSLFSFSSTALQKVDKLFEKTMESIICSERLQSLLLVMLTRPTRQDSNKILSRRADKICSLVSSLISQFSVSSRLVYRANVPQKYKNSDCVRNLHPVWWYSSYFFLPTVLTGVLDKICVII